MRFVNPSSGLDVPLAPYSLRLDALPSEAIADRSVLFRRLFFDCRSEGQLERLVPIGFLWSQLLRSEGNVSESLWVLQIVRDACRSRNDRFVEVVVCRLVHV